MHQYTLHTVSSDALVFQVLKHQAISIHSADMTLICLDKFHMEILQLWGIILENKIIFRKKIIQLFKF